MRTTLLTILVALTGTALGVGGAALTEPAIAIPVAPKHPVVHVYSSEGSASAFPIGRSGTDVIYLTSAHAVGDDAKVYVGGRDETAASSRVEKHPDLDVALIWAPLDTRVIFELSLEPLEFGQHVRTMGWFLGTHLIVTGGYVGANSMSAPIFYGMSGGPVMDDDGKVVGVNDSVMLVADGRGIQHPILLANDYIAISDIADWLRSLDVID